MCARKIVRRNAHDRVGKADRRLAEIRAAPHRLQEEIVNQLVGRVLVHLDLFEHDLLLFGQLLRIEERMQKHIREHVERQRHVPVDDLCVVAGRLFIGEGVEIAADAVHRLGDLRARCGAAFL